MDKKMRVLLVDDEIDLLAPLKFNLENQNFEVFTANSGNEAFELFSNQPLDSIITDIKMPNGDGIQLLKKVKETNAKMPVVTFISGYSEISNQEAYQMGATGILAKPFRVSQLIEKIHWDMIEPNKKWAEVPQTGTESLKIEAVSSKLGRGGLMVQLAPSSTWNGNLNQLFNIDSIPNELGNISGTFWPRWYEKQSQTVGLEFHYVDDSIRAQVHKKIEALNPVAYIPYYK